LEISEEYANYSTTSTTFTNIFGRTANYRGYISVNDASLTDGLVD
jgi:hypothetical protein